MLGTPGIMVTAERVVRVVLLVTPVTPECPEAVELVVAAAVAVAVMRSICILEMLGITQL
jgi:hypothetical protein